MKKSENSAEINYQLHLYSVYSSNYRYDRSTHVIWIYLKETIQWIIVFQMIHAIDIKVCLF